MEALAAASFVIGAALGVKGLDCLADLGLVALAGLGAGESGSLTSFTSKISLMLLATFSRQMKWRTGLGELVLAFPGVLDVVAAEGNGTLVVTI
ncbi:hypothetical protein Tco_0153623 [Tanacetum coccineum]